MKVKKILLGLLIFGASILSISNAGYIRQIGVRGYQPYDQSYNINITKNGTFLTETMGLTKNIFIIDGSTAYFWNKQTGVPYFVGDFGYGGKMEGLFNQYYVCDELIGDSAPTNCSYRAVGDTTKNLIGTFLNTVTTSDYFYFDKSNYCANGSYNCRTQCSESSLCISSSNLSQTICFIVDTEKRGLSCTECTCRNQNALTGNWSIKTYQPDVFSNIPYAFLENPPSVGMNNTGNTNNNTPNTYICPTIQQLINTYGTQYNKNLCYSSTEVYSGGQMIYITPKTIFEIYPTYTGMVADMNSFNNYCRTINLACNTAFSGKNIEYSFIAKIPDNVDIMSLYQYCHLQLDYPDKNTTTCVGSGVTQQPGSGQNQRGAIVTNEDIINTIINNDYTTITPGNTVINVTVTGGTTVVETEGDTIRADILEGREDDVRDIIGSLQSIYNKVTSIFEKRQGRRGIIPDYITRILLLIVLFKIFKK